MRRALWAPVAVAGLILSACATTPPARPVAHGRPHTAPPAESAHNRPPESTPTRRSEAPVADLPGWAEEDHVAALAAFQVGCSASRDPAMRPICADARGMGRVDEATARRFFEANFRAEPVGDPPGSEGVLTAYFAPEYDARDAPDAEFSAPVRPRPTRPLEFAVQAAAPTPVPPPAPPLPVVDDPTDVIAVALAQAEAADDAQGPPADPAPAAVAAPPAPTIQRLDLANADRSQIDRAPGDGALAWMRPEDLFFLQIQGSGVLSLPDGRRLKATYAGDNGRPFVAIARPMVNQGLLGGAGASGENIRGWLAAHRGPDAEAVMAMDPRYVFFALTADDGREPAGAAGIPLPAGRAIAVDPGRHAYGELFWIDASAPVLNGAARTYRRVAMALDTGAAIRGEVRADLYVGRGTAAGIEAGRVRHTLRLTRLAPIDRSVNP